MEESKTKVPEGELKIDASPMALLASIIQLNVRLRYIEEKNAFWDEIYRLLTIFILASILGTALQYLMSGEYNPRAYSAYVVISLGCFCFFLWRKRSDLNINLNTIGKLLEHHLLYIVLSIFSIALHYLITGEYSPRTYSALVVFYFFIYHLYLLWDGSRK